MPKILPHIKSEYNRRFRENHPECNKDYYYTNRNELISKLMEKRLCIHCNKEITFANLSKHRKTQTHLANVVKLQESQSL